MCTDVGEGTLLWVVFRNSGLKGPPELIYRQIRRRSLCLGVLRRVYSLFFLSFSFLVLGFLCKNCLFQLKSVQHFFECGLTPL